MKLFYSLLTFCTLTLAGCAGDNLPISSCVFSPDGKWLVAGGGKVNECGVVKVWDVATWKVHATFKEGLTDRVDAVFFITDETVATVGHRITPQGPQPYDGSEVRTWKIAEKKLLNVVHLQGHRGKGRSVGFSVPSRRVAYWTQHMNVKTFPDLEDKAELKGCPGGIVRFLPDGKRVLTTTRSHKDPHLRLHDATDGRCIATLPLRASGLPPHPTEAQAVDVSPNGKLYAVVTENPNRAYVVATDLAKELFAIDLGDRVSYCIKFTPDNSAVAVQKGRNGVQLYSIETQKPIKLFDANPEGVNEWCFSGDGAWIAITSGAQDGRSPTRIRVFEVKTGKLVVELD